MPLKEPVKRIDLDEIMLTAEQLAKIMNLSVEAVYRYARELGMPRAGKGQYPMLECLQWAFEYYRSQIKGEAAVVDERQKLVKAQRVHQEITTQKLRNELLDAELVQSAIAQMASTYATQLDSLAARLSAKVANLDDPVVINNVIKSECNIIRSATSAAVQNMVDTGSSGGDNSTAAAA